MAEPGSNQAFALETQQKVELYFLALTFTVAGLAIQSAKFSGDRWQWGLEIAGWVCLLTAGIVALIRMQHVPRIFNYAHEATKELNRLAEVKQQPPGSNIKFEDRVMAQPLAVEHLQGNLDFYRKTIDRINSRIGLSGKVQTGLFICGLALVAGARAYGGFFVTFGWRQ